MLKYPLLLCIFFLSFNLIYGAEVERITSSKKIFIATWQVENDGSTDLDDVQKRLNLQTGMSFSGVDDFYTYLDDQKSELLNALAFDSVAYRVTILAEDAEEVRVDVTWLLEQADSFFFLAYPNFDSNRGIGLGLFSSWYNIAGNLFNNKSKSSFFYQPVSPYPTTSPLLTGDNAQYISFFDFETEFEKIRIEQNYWDLSLIYTYQEDLIVNPDLTIKSDLFYSNIALAVGTEFLFTPKFRYIFSVTPQYYWGYYDKKEELLGSPSSSDKNHFRLPIVNGVTLGRLDREDVFYRGHKATLKNTVVYRSYGDVTGENHNDLELQWYGDWIQYFSWGGFNPNYRVGTLISPSDTVNGLGFFLRGVPDSFLANKSVFFLNTSAAFNLIRYRGKMTLQMEPFVDIGYQPVENISFSDNLFIGVGSDFKIFLDAIKNSVIYTSVGLDLSNVYKNNNWLKGIEIQLSMDFFYDNDFQY